MCSATYTITCMDLFFTCFRKQKTLTSYQIFSLLKTPKFLILVFAVIRMRFLLTILIKLAAISHHASIARPKTMETGTALCMRDQNSMFNLRRIRRHMRILSACRSPNMLIWLNSLFRRFQTYFEELKKVKNRYGGESKSTDRTT